MSDFRVKTCVLGQVSTNCYLIYHEKSREAIILDPADNSMYILNQCKELNLKPAAILLTHGHFDHILAVTDIVRAFPINVYAARAEDALLKDSSLNLSESFGVKTELTADSLVEDNDMLHLAGFTIQVIYTPGHTAGSVCYLFKQEEVLFSGDTLFQNSLGRTDKPTGSTADIISSIRQKLFQLPEDTMVYPGHGDPTTIAHEKAYNPVAAYKDNI